MIKFLRPGRHGRQGEQSKQQAIISPLVFNVVTRIHELFDIERDINGLSANKRLAV